MKIENFLEIIPSINVPTFGEVQERIAKVEPYVSWCHLDVTDGVFSKHLTWREPADLLQLQTKLKAEVHLMVEEPEEVIEQWFVAPIRRVIVHVEAMRDPELIIKKCRAAGVEVGFAIRPNTFWGVFEPWVNKVDLLQVLAVNPGSSGQEMSRDSVEKVRHVRSLCSHCIIEVDGGVNENTAQDVTEVGANILVAGNALFSAKNIESAISHLRLW